MHRRISPIGVHVGEDILAAAQVTRAGDLRAWAVIDRAEDEFGESEALRLAGVLDRRGFRGREIAIGASERAALSAVLDVPDRSTGAPIGEIARAELARLHRVDPSSIACELLELPEQARARQGASVLAFGCAHATAEALIRPFQSAGLEVVAIDSRACALARACGGPLAGVELGAALHIGGGGSRIVITRLGAIVYERWFADLGVHSIASEVEQTLRIDRELCRHLLTDPEIASGESAQASLEPARETIAGWAQELARECGIALGYAVERYGGAGCELLMLTGRGARIAHLDELLGESIGCAVRIWRPQDTLARCNDIDDPALALAVGLAMRFDP